MTQTIVEPKYRHEIKYQLYYSDYIVLVNRLKHFMMLDKNSGEKNQYFIRSVYFETSDNKALNEKVDGVNQREKFRLRFYDMKELFIRLEKKMKKNGLCLKVSCRVTRDECENIIRGDIAFLKNHKEPLLNELYFKMTTTGLRAKTIVDYHREAYVYRPGNVRVTFDHDIRTSLQVIDMFQSSLPSAQILQGQSIVLEVKFDEFLPRIIQDLIQTNRHRPQAISKYAFARIYG